MALRKTAPARRLNRCASIIGATALAGGLLPAVQALEIRPSIQVGAVYTDNLNLSASNEVDDIVMRVDPGIVVSHESSRVTLEAGYTYTWLKFQDADESDASFGSGRANLDLVLFRDLLSLESFARRSQRIVDPEQSVWYTNVPIVDNRTDETQIEAGPHLRTEILDHTLDVQYRLGTISYDAEGLQDVDYHESTTVIGSPERNRGLSWTLTHEYQVYEYETPPDSKAQLAFLTMTWGLSESGESYLFGSYGQESDYTDYSSADLEETYWEIGFRRVSGRTRLEAAVGDRSFGSTLRALARLETTGGAVEVAYFEEPSLQESVFGQRNRDFESGNPEVPGTIDRPGIGDRFVWKRFTASINQEFGRNELTLLGFREEREDFVLREEDPLNPVGRASERQNGFVVEVARQLGVRTRLGLQGRFADREFAEGNGDRITLIRLGIDYALGRRTSLEGWLARHKQSGAERASDNYTEDQAGLLLSYRW